MAEPNSQLACPIPTRICDVNPFTNIVARDWLAAMLFNHAPPIISNPLLLLGNGPFQAQELGGFLARFEIGSYLYDGTSLPADNEGETDDPWELVSSRLPPVVVLGSGEFLSPGLLTLLRDDCCLDRAIRANAFSGLFPCWIERHQIGDCILFKRSKSLANVRFLSQEMLLASLFSVRGIPDKLEKPWPEHAAAHPAIKVIPKLKRLVEQMPESFVWPTTQADPGFVSLSGEKWPQIGLLSSVGYKVGANGDSPARRQETLARVFSMHTLPQVESEAYITSWGGANSGARLKKIAESIAAFCRSAKRRHRAALSEAIDDWEKDLAWLKRQYYDGRFDNQFPWPVTNSK